uniref:Ring finger protein 24 n=1 Tax=Scleropages formosus TaxID=113540 RepID=A0A8C9S488_SCLFO
MISDSHRYSFRMPNIGFQNLPLNIYIVVFGTAIFVFILSLLFCCYLIRMSVTLPRLCCQFYRPLSLKSERLRLLVMEATAPSPQGAVRLQTGEDAILRFPPRHVGSGVREAAHDQGFPTSPLHVWRSRSLQRDSEMFTQASFRRLSPSAPPPSRKHNAIEHLVTASWPVLSLHNATPEERGGSLFPVPTITYAHAR